MSTQARNVLQRMDRVTRKIEARYEKRHGESPRGACQFDAVNHETPADLMMAREAEAGIVAPHTLPLFAGMNGVHQTPFEELDDREADVLDKDGREGVLLMLESHFWLLDFLFADGPHPGVVMRRLYAWVKKYRPSAIWDAGYRELGELLGESHGAMEWRIGKLLDDYAKSKGMKGVKMPWQRGAEVSAKLSTAQQGNVNRLGGKKCRKAIKRNTTKHEKERTH